MVEIIDLKKSFEGVEVLKGLNIVFNPGQTNLIIGTSGSGKTVFMKCMLGLHKPTSGSISYDGQPYSDLDFNTQREFRKKIGMVFQGSALFDSMTVEENIMFPLKMFTTMSLNDQRDRANEVINRVNLINANNKIPSEISGGMQKRVAIARAIVNNPKYLFCDEPNSGLDPNTATVIDNLIQEITQEYNITTMINTHDMNSVMEIGDKIIFLKEGHLAWEGDKSQIFKTDNAEVTNFVYSSNLFKMVREAQNTLIG